MQIIRNTGNVSFLTDDGDIYKIVFPNAIIDVIDSQFLQVKFGQELMRINAEDVTATKTLDGVLNAFSGNAYDLAIILQDIFFFDVAGGGGSLATLSDVLLSSPSYGDYLEYNGTAWVNQGLVYTIELIDVLTVDFYAPYDLKINTVSNVLNSPTTTIEDDGVAYTLTNTIASGSKVTVTVDTAAVVNLNIEKA